MKCIRQIDDVLGPRSSRYFGEGFRRVQHFLSNPELSLDREGRLCAGAVATFRYPTDWSTKEEKAELVAHLSSIDALVVSVELSEMLLLSHYHLSDNARRRAWISRVVLKSGSAPQEDLESLDVSASLIGSVLRPQNPAAELVSSVESRIGSLRVTLDIVHEADTFAPCVHSVQSTENLLGPRSSRFCGNGYHEVANEISMIRIEDGPPSAAARAVAHHQLAPASGDYQDLEGYYQPGPSMLDSIVSLSQLSQVVLYSLDGLRRDQTHTMWMRNVTLESNEPPNSNDLEVDLEVTVRRSNLVSLRNATWRTALFDGRFGHIRAKYSLAHELPDTFEVVS